MDMSSAAYVPLSLTELDNIKNPLRLPNGDGVMDVLDTSDLLVRITAARRASRLCPARGASSRPTASSATNCSTRRTQRGLSLPRVVLIGMHSCLEKAKGE